MISSFEIPCSISLIHSHVTLMIMGSQLILFQEVWGRSFCRTIEKLVEVVQEYPGEVEHIFSPTCVPLVRCAGCCGDENLECHPTLTANITMQVCPSNMTVKFTGYARSQETYNYGH
uniref:Platelet-derived growth factor (PDGF) family profile domain-containing protein n=1 Tax=Electrophorus electricus TaxID=8005 RepID=A0A4W4GH31_ELEEL